MMMKATTLARPQLCKFQSPLCSKYITKTDSLSRSVHSSLRDDAHILGLNHNHDADFFQAAQMRKIAPLPTPKRLRPTEDDEPRSRLRSPSPTFMRHANSNNNNNNNNKPASAISTTTPDRTRDLSPSSRPSPLRVSSKQLLSRCHICHRKPTKKSDLDSYTDCESCRRRACYVCLRQCLDWRPGGDGAGGADVGAGAGAGARHGRNRDSAASLQMRDADSEPMENETDITGGGAYQDPEKENLCRPGGEGDRETHHQVVCSRCCVEKGPDGEVVCFGCLPFFEG